MPKLSSFRGKSRWPMPIYVATFDDGTTGRFSFWSPSDKPIDLARGREVCAYGHGTRPDERVNTYFRPPLTPRVVVSGAVEYQGESYADPMTATATIWPDGEAPKTRKASPTVMREALRLIAESNHPIFADLAKTALAA